MSNKKGGNIKSIEIIEDYSNEYVYDITVKDNHNYFANSALVHNCVVVDESLDGDSKILCEDKAYRTIKEIVRNKLNVNVATQNLETNEIEYTPVLNYWEYPCTKECVIIDYEVNGKNLQLKCTEDHLIYTTNRGYVQAKFVNYKDEIIIYNDNGAVKKVTPTKQLDMVYDIETKNHNFFANDMLVHNSHLVSDFAWSSKIYPMLGSHSYKKIIKIGVFMYNNHYHKDFLDKSKRNPIKKIIYPWDKCDIYWNDDNRIVYKGFKMNKDGVYEWDGTSQECPQYIYSCMPINIKKKYFPLNPELWEGNGQMTEQDFRMQMEMEWLDDINLVLKEEQWLAMQNGTHMLEERGTINDIYIFGLDPATGSVNPETLDLDYTALSIWKLLDKKFYNVFNKQWQGDTLLQYDEILRILKLFHVAWGLLDFSSLSPTFLPMLQRDGIKCAGINYQATHPGSGKNWKNFIFNNFVSQIDLGNIFTPKEEELTVDNEKYKFFDKDVLTATTEGLSQWHIINRQRSKKAQNDIIGAPYKEHDDACLVGETLIPLADGRTITIEELSKMSVDNLYAYSLDLDTMLIQRGKILKAWYKGDKKIIKIILDNDENFECTEDHLIMLRDGTYKQAKDLQENDSLMPLYRRTTKGKRKYAGYELTKCLKTGEYIATHKLFTWGGTSPDETVIHHKDYNKKNNNPENLKIMTQAEHMQMHNNKFWNNLTPEQRSERNKKGWANYTEEQKQQRVKNGVQALNDYRVKNCNTQQFKERCSIASKKHWQDPIARQNHIDGIKKRWAVLTPEERSNRMKDLVKKAADAKRGKPNGRKGIPLSEEHKKQISETRKRKFASGELVPHNKKVKEEEYNHKVRQIID
jgi:intein/homing endonuclease